MGKEYIQGGVFDDINEKFHCCSMLILACKNILILFIFLLILVKDMTEDIQKQQILMDIIKRKGGAD